MTIANFPPKDWAFCNGQVLSASDYPSLYSLIGNTYGGVLNQSFALPDLRGRVPIHVGGESNIGPGLSNYYLGQRGGFEAVSLVIAEIPVHNHTVINNPNYDQHIHLSADSATHETPSAGDVPAVVNLTSGVAKKNVKSFGPPTNLVNGQVINSNTGLTIGNTGSSLSHENRQPYLGINYIIALTGLYPLRN